MQPGGGHKGRIGVWSQPAASGATVQVADLK